MINHKKTGASLLGTIVVLLLLALQSESVLAAPGCPSESNPRVGTVGGRRFEISAYVALPDELSEVSTRCTRPKHTIEFDPVAGLRFAALTKTSRPVGGSVVIVIDDFGYRNDWVVEGFLQLDSALTFAVIPGHQFSVDIAARAHRNGHEVLVHMPMQAIGPAPGELEYRLKIAMSPTEINNRVRRAFAEMPHAVGMNNHQGSAATGDARMMNALGAELRQQGVFFLDSVTSADSLAMPSMRAAGVAAAQRDLFLDNVDDVQHVVSQIHRLVGMANEQGQAVGIGHVRPNTLLALQQALPQLKASGQRFAVLSAVVRLTP